MFCCGYHRGTQAAQEDSRYRRGRQASQHTEVQDPAQHLAEAVHDVDLVVGEEAELGGPGQHVLPHLHALKRQADLQGAANAQRPQPVDTSDADIFL